jgi:lipid A ethanolaminephosphotransferase
MNAYSVLIDKNMLVNVFQTDVSEVGDLLHYKLFVYLGVFAVVAYIFTTKISIVYKGFFKEIFYKILVLFVSLLLSLTILFFTYKDVSSFFRNNDHFKSVAIPLNYINALVGYVKLINKQKAENAPQIVISEDSKLGERWKNIHKKTIFVFVLGETARAQNFSLNGYERKTNEPLDPIKKDLIVFHNTQSCGTYTAMSVPCMFSHMPASDFSISEANRYENLLDIIKKVKIDTTWINNNSGCKGICNNVKNMSLSSQDFIKKGEQTYDGFFIDYLKKAIKTNKADKQFYVFHTMGSHGPTYYLRYPSNFAKFTPTCDSADLKNCEVESVVNTYDNTIYYTSYIINEMIKYLKSTDYNVVLMYVSDHGESLGENGLFLHGLPYSLAPKEQKTVPFLFWFSDSFKKEFNLKSVCLQNASKAQVSHDTIFHSVLGLLDIKSSYYNKKLDAFAECE